MNTLRTGQAAGGEHEAVAQSSAGSGRPALLPDAPEQLFDDGRGLVGVMGDEKGHGVGVAGVAVIERRQGGRLAPGDVFDQRLVR